MQAYGPGFARVYNLKWAAFATQVAPLIRDYYETQRDNRTDRRMLDLCCGAGHLAQHFLLHGYEVTGIDLSEPMLYYARENNTAAVATGRAEFLEGDASEFSINRRFDLVVSTYDSLNHLENEQKLFDCFECVAKVNDGFFIFDLNTIKGLRQWGNVFVDESDEDMMIIRHGFYDEANRRAMMKIMGFYRLPNGLYERFDETVFNNAFELERVRQTLGDVGYNKVHFARVRSLATALDDPENEGRVYVVARK